MAKNKIERIDQEITKVREKIAEYQEKLKALEAQKTEAENLEIVQMVRALRMTPTQLSAMLSGGTVPGSLADDNNEQEETAMRNKRLLRTLSAFCLTMVVAFGFTIPAFAQGSEQAPAAPAEDSTNDSNVIVEETEPAPALTPEGNAALVDDFGGNKQLITVTTKAGNYFYILIDRANEDKKTAVHFLNQVDEADLMALMEDENVKEKPSAVCSCTTKCEAGAVNTACPVCATDKSKCTGKAPEPPAETPEPEKEKPAGLNPAAIVLLLALLGGGGVFAYLKLVKNKPKTKGNDSLDDYDYGEEDSEEWETEDEESDEPDADGGSTEEDDEDSVK